MDRDEILRPIVQAVRKGTSLGSTEIRSYFAEWTAIPIFIDDVHAASAVIKGTEIHFAICEDWKPKACYRGRIKEFFADLLKEKSYLTTRVPHGRVKQKAFVQRLGFKPTWSDDKVDYFMLSTVPFERKI